MVTAMLFEAYFLEKNHVSFSKLNPQSPDFVPPTAKPITIQIFCFQSCTHYILLKNEILLLFLLPISLSYLIYYWCEPCQPQVDDALTVFYH